MFFVHKKLKKPPQKVAYLWQLGLFFLCSPVCPKQPRTSFLFNKFFYTFICDKFCDLFTCHFFNTIKLILDYNLRQSIPSFLFWTHREFKRKSRKANFDQWLYVTTPLIFRDKINSKMITHFNFKVNFSFLIWNHLQSNLLRRNLFNRSLGAISVDFGTWYNNIVIMCGFFNFVIALVAIVYYTSNGQPL